MPESAWYHFLEIGCRSDFDFWVRWTGTDYIYRWLHPETNEWIDEPHQITMPGFKTRLEAIEAAKKSPRPPFCVL